MKAFEIASKTVLAALRTGQVGTPVAVRVTAQLDADHGRIERLIARVLSAAATWFDSRPEQVTSFGRVETGHVSTLTLFQGGQSALISAGCCAASQRLLELVVWGNRGILSWDHDRGFSVDTDHESALSDDEKQIYEYVHASVGSQNSIHISASGSIDPGRENSGQTGSSKSPLRSASGEPKLRAQKPPFGVLLVAGDHTHQPQYAQSLASDDRCRLVGLTDEADLTPRRTRLNEQLARRLGVPLLPNLQQALHRDDVHIVSICAEPVRRGRIIVQAAEAGKHLYLDKPLAATLADADAIRKAVRDAGVVSHMWSFVHSDVVARMRPVIQPVRLGELTAFHADLCFAKGPVGTSDLSQRRQETSAPERYELMESKRELSNVGVYPLASLLCVQDKAVRRVCATTGNYFFREHQTNNMEDFGQMLLELEDGTIATISAGRTGWRSLPAGGLNRTTMIGTKQVAVVDAHRPRISVWADVDPWTAPERDPEDPMGMWGGAPKQDRFIPMPRQAWITPPAEDSESDVAWFLDCIESGRSSDVSADVAATATEVLLAAYQSAATGSVVDLPLSRSHG